MLQQFFLHLSNPARLTEAQLRESIERRFIPTPKVLRGQAYGRILEQPDAYRVAGGYRVTFTEQLAADVRVWAFEADAVDPAIATIDYRPPALFEAKATKQYGAHTVASKCDHIVPGRIVEFKTKGSTISLEPYASSYQWRLMVDLFAVPVLTYRIFRLTERRALRDIQELTLTPYRRLHEDCAELVEHFAWWVAQRGLEAWFPERRPALAGPAFEDAPVRETQRPTVRPLVDGEVRTPGTLRRWLCGAEWADHARALDGGRCSAKRYRDQRAHLAALAAAVVDDAFVAAQTREDLEAILSLLEAPYLAWRPVKGQRAGTPYEVVVVAVRNALARLSQTSETRRVASPRLPMRLAPLVARPLAALPASTFTLQRPPAAQPTRQPSLF